MAIKTLHGCDCTQVFVQQESLFLRLDAREIEILGNLSLAINHLVIRSTCDSSARFIASTWILDSERLAFKYQIMALLGSSSNPNRGLRILPLLQSQDSASIGRFGSCRVESSD